MSEKLMKLVYAPNQAASDVLAERRRQQEIESWTADGPVDRRVGGQR